jgi:CBS domain-containing protein
MVGARALLPPRLAGGENDRLVGMITARDVRSPPVLNRNERLVGIIRLVIATGSMLRAYHHA